MFVLSQYVQDTNFDIPPQLQAARVKQGVVRGIERTVQMPGLKKKRPLPDYRLSCNDQGKSFQHGVVPFDLEINNDVRELG
jgi:hypothetical protein